MSTTSVYTPATGKLRKTYELQTKEQGAKIIDAAHEAYLSWREEPIEKRAEVIRKLGKLLQENKEKLAQMAAEQMGKPIKQGMQEVELCANICEYTAEHGPGFLQDEKRSFDGGEAIITYRPLGVILAMQPWNFPVYQIIRYSVANLLAGNTTALKHSEIVWDIATFIKELFVKAGLPADAFGILYINDETVDELISHDKVRGVTLTGSAKAGRIVAEIAGKHLKKTLLELGGSDPYLILEDVKVDDILNTCVIGRTNNAGQTCIAAKRFIVVESIYDEFKEKFVKAMEAVSYGDPTKKDTQMGPMARKDLREGLHKQVQTSIEKGATCLTGGKLPDTDGYFYPATVLEHVKPGMPAYDEELFGPVAALIKVKDEAEAIKVANDHSYGLGGGVFSSDVKRATDIAKYKIESGMVNVNGYNIVQPNIPFGGIKDSGYGREHGSFGILEFVNIKSVLIAK